MNNSVLLTRMEWLIELCTDRSTHRLNSLRVSMLRINQYIILDKAAYTVRQLLIVYDKLQIDIRLFPNLIV